MVLNIDIVDAEYILTGDIDLINKRIKSNFEEHGGRFAENQLIVPFSSDKAQTKEKYEAIIRICEKFKIEYSESETVLAFVAEVKKENNKFLEFASKAKSIRNNNHTGDDFKIFTDAISQYLVRELYDSQLLSAYHLAFAQNACNFSVPGAGKTSIVYAAYIYLKNLPPSDAKHINSLLVISPLAAFGPWIDEYKGCFGKEAKAKKLVSMNPKERQDYYYSSNQAEITLVSYQTASQDSDSIGLRDFLRRDNIMLILDEAHYIKNLTGKWSQAILPLAPHASARVVLTGTPAPNGYEDLHNLFKFIWPSKDIIEFPVDYLQKMTKSSLKSEKKKLIDRISPFFIRIKKSHLKLPKPIENSPRRVKMTENQRIIYEYIEKKYIRFIEREIKQEVNSYRPLNQLTRARLIRLMQCSTNPSLLRKPLDEYLLSEGLPQNLEIDDRAIFKLIMSKEIQNEVPNKFIEAANLVKQILKNNGPDGRVVIWAISIGNIIQLKKYLESAHGIQSELLYGSTPNEHDDTTEALSRQEIVRNFHSPNCSYRVIIANPSVVGESISLHKACRNAIYLERNFNAGIFLQSKDRIHRYGLKDDDEVNYHYLITESTVDATIHERLLEKEHRMLQIIENEEIPLLDLNMNDKESEDDINNIRAIIEDYHARTNTMP